MRSLATDDTRLLEGLRSRRLFRLASKYCENELASQTLTPQRRAALTVELIKTQTTRALFSPASNRQPYWDSIAEIVDAFIKSSPVGQGPPPRTFLVRVQQALSHVAHANLLAQEIAAELAEANSNDLALLELRTARTQLDSLRQDMADAIPKRRNRTLEGQLESDELLALSNSVQFQLAKCNLIRARLYRNDREGQVGRIDALSQVQSQLTELSRSLATGEPLWWETKIARVQSLRLSGKVREANSVLMEAAEYEVPGNIAATFLQEKMLLALAAKNRPAMKQLFMFADSPTMPQSAPLEIAILKVAVELALGAADENEKSIWMGEASRRTKAIELAHGNYWGRRAELILINAVGGSVETNRATADTGNQPMVASSTEVDLLTRVANEALRKKRFGDALKAYDNAIATAKSQGNSQVLLTLQIGAGQALEGLGNRRDAARRMIESADKYQRDSSSANVHLRGCWNQWQVVAAQYANSEAQQLANSFLVTSLKRHLEIWPQSDSSGQAAIWLGAKQSEAGAYDDAFETYLKVPTNHRQFPFAIAQAKWNGDRYLVSLPESSRASAVDQLAQQIGLVANKLNPASGPAFHLAIANDHLRLLHGRTADLDESRLKAASQLDSLQVDAKILMILLPNQSIEQMRAAVNELTRPEDLSLLDRYLDAKTTRSPNQKNDLITLRQEVTNKAIQLLTQNSAADSADLVTAWQMRNVDLLVATEQYSEAIAQLETLEKKFPRKADVKMKLARALTEAYQTSDPQKPLDKWRLIASRLRAGSENWFEAKLNVVKLLNVSGEQQTALKLLKFVEVTQDWSKSKFANEFDQLKATLK